LIASTGCDSVNSVTQLIKSGARSRCEKLVFSAYLIEAVIESVDESVGSGIESVDESVDSGIEFGCGGKLKVE